MNGVRELTLCQTTEWDVGHTAYPNVDGIIDSVEAWNDDPRVVFNMCDGLTYQISAEEGVLLVP